MYVILFYFTGDHGWNIRDAEEQVRDGNKNPVAFIEAWISFGQADPTEFCLHMK
jgi:hypothetical protein